MMTLTRTQVDTPVSTTRGEVFRRRELTDRIPLRLALAVSALWVVSIYVVFSLAPAPTSDPSTTAILIGMAFDFSVLGTLAGLAVLRRWGLLASAAGGAVFLFGAALCSLGGHTGSWLVAQYVTGVAILGVSGAAFRRF